MKFLKWIYLSILFLALAILKNNVINKHLKAVSMKSKSFFANISKLLSDKRYKDCQSIQVNWLIVPDNEKLYYEKMREAASSWEEVKEMLAYYSLSEHYDAIQDWYDSYQ